jgi:hypothetical protein
MYTLLLKNSEKAKVSYYASENNYFLTISTTHSMMMTDDAYIAVPSQ